MCQVALVGSSPATESLPEIRASKLLLKVWPRDRPQTTIFSDGNVAWGSEARRLNFRHRNVNHQAKEFVKKVSKPRGRKGSGLAGAQKIDRLWQSLKRFVGSSWPRKIGHGSKSRMHPEMPQLVSQFMWRHSLGSVSPEDFLDVLCKEFAKRDDWM